MLFTSNRHSMAPEKTAVIGLGYVGIPLSALLASSGYDVVGIDLLEDRVAQINRGKLPLKGDEPGLGDMLSKAVKRGKLRATTSYDACGDRTVIFVCVDTPIDADKRPDYSRLEEAVAGIGRNMQRGTMVVVESTLAPGTMLGIVVRTLEKESGLQLGREFKLAHCPERVMPGRLLYNITTYDRVIGALDKQTALRAKAIYSKLTKGQLHTTDLTTAEIVKTAENAYRDVQIAFANEVALVCPLGSRLELSVIDARTRAPIAGASARSNPRRPWSSRSSAMRSGGARGSTPSSPATA